jgi:hypothetical protein
MRYNAYQHSVAVQAYAYISVPVFLGLMYTGYVPLAIAVALFNIVVLVLGRSGVI